MLLGGGAKAQNTINTSGNSDIVTFGTEYPNGSYQWVQKSWWRWEWEFVPGSVTKYTCVLNAGTDPLPIWIALGWENQITMYLGGWKYQTTSKEKSFNSQYNMYEQINYKTKTGKDIETGTLESLTRLSSNEVALTTTHSYSSILSNKYPNKSVAYRLKGQSGTPVYYKYNDGELGYGFQVDYWQEQKKETGFCGNPVEETYAVRSYANDNARSEYLDANIIPRYEYPFATRNNERGKGNPFTVPCFGGFMKFEPEVNGTVELYVMQNGIINLSEDGSNSGGLQDKATWRPTYIVDELGNRLESVKAETSSDQTVYIGYDAAKEAESTLSDQTTPKKPTDSTISAFYGAVASLFSENQERANVLKDFWGPSGSKSKIITPEDYDDGWVVINKGYVKYTFPVVAGKSYYVFNNDSKLGFCGYNFTPTTTDWKGDAEVDEEQTFNLAAGQYKSVTINRTFKPGWNAICLPFSVTESKMREWFGTGKDGETVANGQELETYELVTYNGAKDISTEGIDPNQYEGIEPKGVLIAHFFHHAYQDIVAGIPYMLYIPKGAKALQPESIENGKTKLKFNIVTVEEDIKNNLAVFSSCKDYIPAYVKEQGTEEERKRIYESDIDYFSFVGNLSPTNVREGSYVVYANSAEDTGIRRLGASSTMKGFRSHLQHNRNSTYPDVDNLVRIAGTNFSNILDNSTWDNPTIINDLAAEMGFFNERENVYSITGQLIRQNTTSLVGLPKGVYIVNGKKYFVK